jgi:hypothetical protein
MKVDFSEPNNYTLTVYCTSIDPSSHAFVKPADQALGCCPKKL